MHSHEAGHTVELYESLCVHLQPPEIEKCSMLAVKHYEVIVSNEDEVISHKIHNTTNFLFEHSNYHFNSTFIINITVIDNKGQRSNPTVITKTIGIQNMTSSKCTDNTVRTTMSC